MGTTTHTRRPVDAAPSRTPRGTRVRRPSRVLIGLGLVATGGLLAVWLATANSSATAVIVLTQTVRRGEVIEETDLRAMDLPSSHGLRTVPASDLPARIGQRAHLDLAAGGVLTPGSSGPESLPGVGDAVVGVSALPRQLPGTALAVGDRVSIISTDTESRARSRFAVEVVGVTPDPDTGATVVDVVLRTALAGDLAQVVADDGFALVLEHAGDPS